MIAPERNAVQGFKHLAGLYCFYLRIYFRKLVEYRADTWVALIAGFLTQASTLAFLTVIFRNIPMLAGWTYYELLFLFGLSVAGRELNKVFFNVPFSLTGYIRSGMLDIFLIRPVGPLFQGTGLSTEINGIGSALTALGIMAFAGAHLDIHWTIGKLLYVAVALLSSMLIVLSILLAFVILSFWILEIRSVIYPLAWLYDFTRYPIEIFSPFVRGLLTYVLPFAIGTFYPAAFLLRGDPYTWAAWGVPLVAAALILLTYQLWRFGLRRYSSAAG